MSPAQTFSYTNIDVFESKRFLKEDFENVTQEEVRSSVQRHDFQFGFTVITSRVCFITCFCNIKRKIQSIIFVFSVSEMVINI